MKKIILISVLGFIPAVALIGNIYAQNSSVRTLLVKDAKTLLADTAALSPSNFNANDLSTISSKAIKSFGQVYSGAANVSWYKISDGFSASFSQNGNFNRAYFDKKGRMTYCITYYDGKKLPRDIYTIVKSTYFDCEIPFVEEIHDGDHIVYLVHLQDETSWKKVKVCDGEMTLVEDFNKN
jgi:hypothetical protein